MEPTTPALHCAMTRSGLEMMNMGEATTGRRRRSLRTGGSAMALARFALALEEPSQFFLAHDLEDGDHLLHPAYPAGDLSHPVGFLA